MFDLKGYETSLLEGAWVTLEVALASLLLMQDHAFLSFRF